MIVGIGVDLVEIERVRRSLARFGDRFAQKILSSREMALFSQRGRDPAWLAKRFAAKEAAAKALGTGMRRGVHFPQITIERSRGGPPQLMFSGVAQQTAAGLGATRFHVSLSDEAAYATAFVVLEGP
jgi:holo-[acyl-carrier protein] synthase